jgi:hypothetical protein
MKLGTLTQFTLITLPAIAAFKSAMDIWAPFDLAEGVEVTLQHGGSVDTMDMSKNSKEVNAGGCFGEENSFHWVEHDANCSNANRYGRIANLNTLAIEPQTLNISMPNYRLSVSNGP